MIDTLFVSGFRIFAGLTQFEVRFGHVPCMSWPSACFSSEMIPLIFIKVGVMVCIDSCQTTLIFIRVDPNLCESFI